MQKRIELTRCLFLSSLKLADRTENVAARSFLSLLSYAECRSLSFPSVDDYKVRNVVVVWG